MPTRLRAIHRQAMSMIAWDWMAWDCLIAPGNVQIDGREALAAVFHQQRRPVASARLAPRIVKASAKRGDRTWPSREVDDTYGSLGLDQAGADCGLSQPVTPRTRNVTDNWFLASPTGKRQQGLGLAGSLEVS